MRQKELSNEEITKRIDTLENNRRVLIISSDKNDYEQFKNYFANIDYFKSMVRAEKYFAAHPEALDEYSIIILGKNTVLSIPADEKDELKLPKKIKDRAGKAFVAEITTNNAGLSDVPSYEAKILPDSKISMSQLKYNYLVEAILAKAVRKNVAGNFPEASDRPSITNDVKPEIALPSSTANLKVLIVGPLAGNNEEEKEKRRNEIIRKLYLQTGINVKYAESSATSFSAYVRDHLGDYDIIINDGSCLGNVSTMDEESTEQCKDTGRQLTVLMNYYSRLIGPDKPAGTDKRRSDLDVSLGGTAITAPHNDRKLKTISENIPAKNKDDSLIEAFASMVRHSVEIYQNKATELEATHEERKAQTARELEDARAKEKKDSLLRTVNGILTIAKRYLNQKRQIRANKIEVTQSSKGIHIYNWDSNTMISSLMLIESPEGIAIRIATIKQGRKLGPMKDLYLSLTPDGTDVLPDEMQESTIKATLTRIKTYIEEPLNRVPDKKRKKRHP